MSGSDSGSTGQAAPDFLGKLDSLLGYPIDFMHNMAIWLFLPALLAIVITDITLRTFFNSPLSWGHEVLGLLLICLFSLELPRCLRRHELLSVDLLFDRIDDRFRRQIYRLSRLLILLFAVLFCWQGGAGALEMYEYEEQAFILPIMYWPFALTLGLVGMLLVFQSLLQLIGGEPFDDKQEHDIEHSL